MLSRYVLPQLFHQIARRPELILLGALAWCFLIGEIAEKLHLSREMGSLVAGRVALDLSLCARRHRQGHDAARFLHHAVLRRARHDHPDPELVGDRAGADHRGVSRWCSRVVTTFTPLYLMKQGLRASLLPAINLAQISEFSLVVIQTGVAAGHIQTETASAASFAFVVLAVLSTFVMMRSDQITRARDRLR